MLFWLKHHPKRGLIGDKDSAQERFDVFKKHVVLIEALPEGAQRDPNPKPHRGFGYRAGK